MLTLACSASHSAGKSSGQVVMAAALFNKADILVFDPSHITVLQ